MLLPGGWLRTGDVVVADSEGFVRVVDRIKELIITGGFNVYPSEVENVLRELPEIEDVAAMGIRRGDSSGEEIVVAIVPTAGATVVTRAGTSLARERLAAYKVPRRVVIVGDLPRSQIGKVLRRHVRDQIEAIPGHASPPDRG